MRSSTQPHRTGRLAAVAAAASLALLTACGGTATTGDTGSGTATKKLRIAATGADSLPFMAILQVAIDKGWFKEKGLDVSIYSGGGGGSTLRVVTSGDADMGIAGGTSVVLAAQRPSSNMTIVAPWFQVNDFYWITPKADAQMKGAKLGFSSAGSTTELTVKALQKEVGGGIEAVSVGGMGDNWAAAKSGRITAGWAMHPFVTEKQQEEGAKVLVAARDKVGDFPADLVAVNADYADANPENIKAFFQVVDKAFGYVTDDPDAAAGDIAKLIDVDPDVVKQALKDTPELSKAYSLKVDPEALRNLSTLMVEAGQISKPVDWSKLLDQQYLPADAKASF